MADLGKTLIRSVVRAFYETEHILVVDALFIHSALRDDDLAYLLGMQVKPLRKLCGKLREAGLISVQSRQELREGANRPFARDYFYIDPHFSIDSIKYRISRLTSTVSAQYAPTARVDRKEFFCNRCHAEYTQMEVLDRYGPEGFECHRCGHILEFRASDASEEAGAGSATQSRLMEQLSSLLEIMAKIDKATVPGQTFEQALALALPVVRTDGPGGTRATSLLEDYKNSKPLAAAAAVKGQTAQAAEKIEINLTTETESAAAAAESEALRKERLAKQNALPEWHTKSTLTGEATALGAKEAAATKEREANGAAFPNGTAFMPRVFAEDEIDDKKALINGTGDGGDTSMMDEYFKALKEEQQRAEREDAEDEEDDEDEDLAFEDVPVIASSNGMIGNSIANGIKGTDGAHSSMNREEADPSSSQPVSSGDTDSGESRRAKRSRVDVPATDIEVRGFIPADTKPVEESEEDEFEDVM